MKRSLLISVALLLTIGCTKTPPSAKPVPPTGIAGAQHEPTQNKNDIHEFKKAQGIVLDAQQKTGFNYIELKTTDGTEWFVVLDGSIKKGDHVTLRRDIVKKDFHSKVLDRTFKKLTFGSIMSDSLAAK